MLGADLGYFDLDLEDKSASTVFLIGDLRGEVCLTGDDFRSGDLALGGDLLGELGLADIFGDLEGEENLGEYLLGDLYL